MPRHIYDCTHIWTTCCPESLLPTEFPFVLCGTLFGPATCSSPTKGTMSVLINGVSSAVTHMSIANIVSGEGLGSSWQWSVERCHGGVIKDMVVVPVLPH